jgi:hypothetical protein
MSFDEKALCDKLARFSNTQQSIETLAQWCMFHAKRASKVRAPTEAVLILDAGGCSAWRLTGRLTARWWRAGSASSSRPTCRGD